MATKAAVADFINEIELQERKKAALMTRLNGLSQNVNEELTDHQLVIIFEGLLDLKDQLMGKETSS